MFVLIMWNKGNLVVRIKTCILSTDTASDCEGSWDFLVS